MNVNSVLTGNPGTSKSWFHWYILYCVVNGKVNRFKLIVRQVAENKLVFIFPEFDRVYYTLSVREGVTLLSMYVQPDAALLLVEPADSLKEPQITGISTILTCSPDKRRYKEFLKKGAAKHYMPVWKLDELQLVAAHIRERTNDKFLKEALTPEGIRKRYHCFGGIFCYVIPVNKTVLTTVESEQRTALGNAKAADTFIRAIDIEKRDSNKENISHFLLQYDVNEDSFLNFTMKIDELLHMFRGGKKSIPLLFEFVVFLYVGKRLRMDCMGWSELDKT